MKMTLSYHNDPAIKAKYLNRLKEHRRLEHLTQGVGWAIINGHAKGCAVGCTLNSYDHSRYPIEIGLPEWMAYLEEHFFERLPKGEAEQFAEDFLEAIPVGVDMEPVRHKLAIWRHEQALVRLANNTESYAAACRNAIKLVIKYHRSCIAGKVIESARSAARTAAWTAAWTAAGSAESAESARSAAESAAESAARLARLTESAARSAESAAWSAESAAWSAVWSVAESAESAAELVELAGLAARSAESAARSYYKSEAAMLIALLRAEGMA